MSKRPTIETDCGTEIQCARCGDFWPADKEFFYFSKGRPHSWCKDCYRNDTKQIAKNERWRTQRSEMSAATKATIQQETRA